MTKDKKMEWVDENGVHHVAAPSLDERLRRSEWLTIGAIISVWILIGVLVYAGWIIDKNNFIAQIKNSLNIYNVLNTVYDLNTFVLGNETICVPLR